MVLYWANYVNSNCRNASVKSFSRFGLIIVFLFSFIFLTAKANGQNNCDLSGFVTYTQAGWFSKSNSEPGKIRDQYFSTVFPNGLTIGSTYTLILSNASAVQELQTGAGNPSFFTQNYYNAITTSAGELTGQLVALAMNIAFDKAGKTGHNSVKLENLVLTSGDLAGKTVAEVFYQANQAIGGKATDYSFSQLNEAAAMINENFESKTDKGNLTCPPPPASIGDKVWNDTNKNGIQDNGESGVAGVTVNLYCSKDCLEATATTNSNGIYTFNNVYPGKYYVKFFLPSGYVFSPKNSGSNDALDSDADQLTGRTELTDFVSGENSMNWDAGIYKQVLTKASLGNLVWNDVNQNGLQDSGEKGISGVTVKLFNAENIQIATETTDINGNYLFDELSPGSYYVVFSLINNYQFSPRKQGTNDAIDSDADQTTGKSQIITLTGGCSNLAVDAGMYLCVPQKSSIGDRVWNDQNGNGIQDAGESGVPWVIVELHDCSGNLKILTVTDVNGNYLFSNLDAGDYYVQVTLPIGYVFTIKNSGNRDDIDSDFDQTTGKTDCFTLATKNDDRSRDAGIYVKKSSIGDRVWNDVNKNGIQDNGELGIGGVTVKLYSCSGTQISTKTTNNNGVYVFDNLIPGDYYIRFELPADYSFSPMNTGSNKSSDSDAEPATGRTLCIPLAPGVNDLTWDAGMYYCQSQQNADLSLLKKVNNNNPQIGENIFYTLTLTNSGPANATGIVITDLLPSGLDFVSATPEKGSYNNSTGKWTLASLNKNETADLILNAKVNPNSVSTGTIDLGIASGFNLFVFEDLDQPSSDTQGKVAVGHDATLSNYSVGDQLQNSNGKTDVLIVGNNLTFTSGAVYGGNVVYGNSTNLPQFSVSISNGTLRKDNPINFGSAWTYLKSLSKQLSNTAVNGICKFEWGSLNLTGTDPFLNVFKVCGCDISKANNMSINVPNGSVVLVNIEGETVKWTGGLTVSGTNISNVLYNFYQASSLTIQGIDIRGSILAPYAEVNFISGVQNGQMIAKSLYGQGQLNNSRFIGNIPLYSDIVNVAEVTLSAQHDPDSTPGNGNPNEDDFASVSIHINTTNNPGAGGVGEGSGNTNWQYVGNFSNDEIIWEITTDNSGNLLAGTWGGKIYKSTDQGESWNRINPNMNAIYIWSMTAAPNGNLFAGTEKGIFVSDNQGTTWTLSGLVGKDVRTLIFKDNELYAGTWGNGMFRSVDNGKVWTDINNGLSCMAVHAITLNSKSEIFAGTFGGGVFRSSDHGASWQKTNMPYDFVWTLETTLSGTVLAGTYGDGVYRSTDGINFSKANTGLTSQYIYGVSANTDGKLYVSSWNSGVYSSTDGGDNWNSLGLTGLNVSSIKVEPNSNSLYVGTSNGTIYKNSADITELNGNKMEIPERFELIQNYPNPFNPSTLIKFSIHEPGYYSLKVYDILGKETATLVNGELKAGKYSVRFEAEKLSTGIYIYRLIGNNVNLVKKMMFIK